MRLQPIVEGRGEVDALPNLVHRVCNDLGGGPLLVLPPIRANRSQLVREDGLRERIDLARQCDDLRGILVLFDADRDCPKQLAAKVTRWARRAADPIPCEIVLAKCEFEAWLLGGIEGLRGIGGFSSDVDAPRDPESIRDAKGELRRRMIRGWSYRPTIDQLRLTRRFDLHGATARCRSFRRLKSALRSILDRAA